MDEPNDEELASFLAGFSGSTRVAYQRALRRYAEWAADDGADALQRLSELDEPAAVERLAAFSAALGRESLASRPIVLSGLRAWRRWAGARGATRPAPVVGTANRRSAAYPAAGTVKALLRVTYDSRDRAILCLFAELRLRRGQVVALDYEDVDLEGRRLLVKSRRGAKVWPLPINTVAALRVWLAARGDAPGPLFLNRDRAAKGAARLSGDGLARLVAAAGQRSGQPGVTIARLRRAGLAYESPRSQEIREHQAAASAWREFWWAEGQRHGQWAAEAAIGRGDSQRLVEMGEAEREAWVEGFCRAWWDYEKGLYASSTEPEIAAQQTAFDQEAFAVWRESWRDSFELAIRSDERAKPDEHPLSD
jgi:integrase